MNVDMKEMAKNIGLKMAVGTGLIDLLQGYKVAELIEIAKNFEIEKYSKMKKQELAEAIAHCIKKEDVITKVALLATEEEYQFASLLSFGKKIKDQWILPNTTNYFMGFGCVYLLYDDNSFSYYMPQEVKDVFEKLKANGLVEKRNRMHYILGYIQAMVNLYGIVTPQFVKSTFEEQNEEGMTEEEFADVVALFKNKENGIFMYQGNFVQELFANKEEYDSLCALQGKKPYYMPDKYDLLQYKNEFYHQLTGELLKFKAYVLKELCSNEVLVENVIDEIHICIAIGYGSREIFKVLERANIVVKNKKQAKQIAVLLVDVLNNTRSWANRGYTPKALAAEDAQYAVLLEKSRPEPIKSEKVGRNEPCPCGSGKKYKKCCGK